MGEAKRALRGLAGLLLRLGLGVLAGVLVGALLAWTIMRTIMR